MSFKDLKGQRFGRLNVIEDAGYDKRRKSVWKCKCDCGEERDVNERSLVSGHTRSCGCLGRELASERMKKVQLATHTHEMSKTRFYTCWIGMMRRCDTRIGRNFINYGNRGIVYCERWKSFDNFKNDMYESYLEHSRVNGEKDTTLERNDVDGNYTIENCKWVTKGAQARNRRSNNVFEYNGESLPLIAISEIVNIPYQTLAKRIYAGWEFNDAISRPVEIRFRSKSHA